ncbi:MAG: hypothetical protein ABH822_02715 [Patescibacteria group bacterium]
MDVYLPEKHTRRRRLRQKIKIYAWLVLVIVVVGALIWWLFFSGFWEIRAFNIEGVKTVAEEDVLERLKQETGPTNNLWLWPSGELIFDDWPLLASVEISKNFFKQSIEVIVQEREPIGIWCASNACFWFDEEGVVFDVAPRPDGGLIVAIDDRQGDLNIELGQTILSQKPWSNFMEIINSWLVGEMAIHNLTIDRERQELRTTTAFGSDLFFSYRFNPKGNLIALKQLRDKGGVDLRKVQYVDLRVENRIYYK